MSLFPPTVETLTTPVLAILTFYRSGGQSRCVIGRTKVPTPPSPSISRKRSLWTYSPMSQSSGQQCTVLGPAPAGSDSKSKTTSDPPTRKPLKMPALPASLPPTLPPCHFPPTPTGPRWLVHGKRQEREVERCDTLAWTNSHSTRPFFQHAR